ncbi:MAG: Flp pilus assembly complex ATPase component TadA [Clostridia bacterium]|nr:Flp pilus assembly complex ATPase component TadA [Clostridia bacterium]
MTEYYDFREALSKTQEYISKHYSQALVDNTAAKYIKSYVEKYLTDHNISVRGYDSKSLTEKIVNEMSGYSILTPLLNSDSLEEININGWDDIAVTYRDGRIEKQKDIFFSRQHAVDIVKRLLNRSGMIIDSATPVAQGHLPGNSRITVLKSPVVDEERGIAVSIRILRPASIKIRQLYESGFATEEMLDFLCTCVRYGVPFVISGATSSGKTTLLNAVLESVPDDKRIFTIESGSRELSLIKKVNGSTVNNVVHTLSRPSDNELYDITQEELVVASLRFDPDIICVGEMRDVECYSAVEASLTGHTVVSTVHSGPGELCHTRIALLCQKRFPIDFKTSLSQVAQAFPVVIYTHKLENNERKCMDISECIVNPATGDRKYSTLYSYDIERTEISDGKYYVFGSFVKKNGMSESLRKRMIQNGIPSDVLTRFAGKGRD